jgi:hypothetical protein
LVLFHVMDSLSVTSSKVVLRGGAGAAGACANPASVHPANRMIALKQN